MRARCWRGLWEHRHSPPLRRLPEKATINHPHIRSRSQLTRDLQGKRKQSYSQMVFATYARMFLSFVMNLRQNTSFLQAKLTLGFYTITTSQSMTSSGKWCSQPTNMKPKMLPKHSVDSSMLKSRVPFHDRSVEGAPGTTISA
jgi:hypothetical protein